MAVGEPFVVLACVDTCDDRRVLRQLNGTLAGYQTAIPVSAFAAILGRAISVVSAPAVAQEGQNPSACGASVLASGGADPAKRGCDDPVRLLEEAGVSLPARRRLKAARKPFLTGLLASFSVAPYQE